MNRQLRDYQQTAVDNVRNAYAAGDKAPLLVLPTGGGKTFVFCYIAESVAARGKRIYILVHRSELLIQTMAQLSDLGVEHGAIAPGYTMTVDPVQVASVQTIVRRLEKLPEPDLIIVDEAHHSQAGTWSKILKHWPKSRVLGVTATPCRMDGKGLGVKSGGFYDQLIIGPSMRELIKRGHLSDYVYYAPPVGLSLDGVKTIAGDYDKHEISDRMDKPAITGCAVEHYKRICPGVPAIAFCTSVAHAEHVATQFRDAGFTSESVDGTMSPQARKNAISGLGDGRIQILTSCDIISEGTDIPVVSAAILLRPTKSTGLNLQQVGRVLRTHPSKTVSYILDHVGNYKIHGMPDDDRDWTLDGFKQRKKSEATSVDAMKTCDMCFAAYRSWIKQCPQCGHVNETKRSEIEQRDGELQKIERGMVVEKKKKFTNDEYNKLRKYLAQAKSKGLSKSAAFQMFYFMKKKGVLV